MTKVLLAGFRDAETGAPVSAVATVESTGLSLRVPRHGTSDVADGEGPVVLLEFRRGIPTLVVWADICSQEPTHTISLAGAAAHLRLPAQED